MVRRKSGRKRYVRGWDFSSPEKVVFQHNGIMALYKFRIIIIITKFERITAKSTVHTKTVHLPWISTILPFFCFLPAKFPRTSRFLGKSSNRILSSKTAPAHHKCPYSQCSPPLHLHQAKNLENFALHAVRGVEPVSDRREHAAILEAQLAQARHHHEQARKESGVEWMRRRYQQLEDLDQHLLQVHQLLLAASRYPIYTSGQYS